jgi:hypothetical protein
MTKLKEINKEEDIKSLIKNYNLLRIVEKIEARKTNVLQTSLIHDRNIQLESSDKNLTKKKSINEEKNDPKSKRDSPHDNNLSDLDQKCKKHLLPIHSYAIGTNLLFCDKCIMETNLKTYPLPNVF